MRRPTSRSGPYSHQRSLVSNISDPHLAGGPLPIQICSPAYPYHVQRQRSRYSPTFEPLGSTSSATIRGKSTPASVFDLLQLPPGNAHAHPGSRFSDRLVSSSNDCADLSRFSAPLEVDWDLLTDATPSRLLGHPSSLLLKSASCPIRHPMHAPTVADEPDLSESMMEYQRCHQWLPGQWRVN